MFGAKLGKHDVPQACIDAPWNRQQITQGGIIMHMQGALSELMCS
jgi:hypothetical protein